MPGLAMAERVSARVAASTEAECDLALDEAPRRNAEDLFAGANVCALYQREDDAAFLLLAGQARATADMELAMPAELPEANEAGVIDLSHVAPPPAGVLDLWAFIYAYAGGAGPTELYRDQERTDRLFERLRTWRPVRPDGYDPGWTGSRTATEEAYSASIDSAVEHRIEQLALG